MHRPRILIVDDDPLIRDMARRSLEHCRYEVQTAGDAELCLDLCHAAPPDVVLLDAVIEDGSSLEIARQLRSTPETRAVPIVVLSGGAATFGGDRGSAARHDGYGRASANGNGRTASGNGNGRTASGNGQHVSAAQRNGRVATGRSGDTPTNGNGNGSTARASGIGNGSTAEGVAAAGRADPELDELLVLADAAIDKPFNADMLLAIVRRALDHHGGSARGG